MGKNKRKTKNERKKEIQKMNIRKEEATIKTGILYKINCIIPQQKWMEGFFQQYETEGYTLFGVLISEVEVLALLQNTQGEVYRIYEKGTERLIRK